MAEGSGSRPRRTRLITDTCSALKLLGIGEKIYRTNALVLGDLVIHARFFTETRKWGGKDPRTQKYKQEFELARSIGSVNGLSIDRDTSLIVERTLKQTRDALGLPVGQADIDQLVTIVHHDLALVTNDTPFSELADAFEVSTYTAEKILIEAITDGLISIEEAREILKKWKANGEKKATKEDAKELSALGIPMKNGYITD